MALYVHGQQVTDHHKTLYDLESFLKLYSATFESKAATLKAKDVIKVSNKDATLYVYQREFAVLSGDSSCLISKVGTDMATTCHMVVIYHKNSKVAALGHFDGCNTKQGVNDMVGQMQKEIVLQSNSSQSDVLDLDLRIVGGFRDGKCSSEQLSMELLREFHQYSSNSGAPSVRLHLTMFCASFLNNVTIENCTADKFSDQEIDSPVIFGIVLDAKTGELNPAVFEENAKTPVSDVRSSRSLMGVKCMASIFNHRDSTFTLKKFSYEPFEQIEIWLQQPDHIIKKYMSTSPEVEPSNFCDQIRATLRFIRNNPDPLRTVFGNKNALVFEAKISQGCLTWNLK